MEIQKRERFCRHCKESYGTRAGRGLCNACWRQKSIRDNYPPLAPFGGAEAGKFATVKAKDKPHDNSN